MNPGQERTLGRYRLVSLLGEGGMGKVYKAHDSVLERHVAIKILPADLLTDPSRVARFVQEARAASALNHPNVIAVYDIGEEALEGSESVRYIAMELIDGGTLREQMASGAVDLRKALKLVLQVTEALTAAHAAGIVHRDLKPENIMVTSSGYAKVLDFGLAKLRVHEGSGESATFVKGTHPGVVLGTAGYMSPEQARGSAVDHRADIFSLGCVLYELVAGRRAFEGDSSVDTLHKIIHTEPEPLRTLRPSVPPELVRIIRKALAKDPEERYQTAKDLAIDLRELLREIDSNPSGVVAEPAAAAPRKRTWLWPAVIVLVIAAAAAAVLLQPRGAAVEPAPSAQIRVTRVTASGKVISAAISPDQKFVAYVVSDQGEQALWVRQTASGQSLQLIPDQRIAYWGLAFSPDGEIYYGAKGTDEPGGAIYQISTLGGAPRKIIGRIDSPPTFSPDGKRMAFLRAQFPTAEESAIIVANIDGTDEKRIAAVRAPELFVPIFFAGPSWSPDGSQIAAGIVNRDAGEGRVAAADVASGAIKTIAEADWAQVGQVAWLPGGKRLIAIAQRRGDVNSQVWSVRYPEGAATQLTNDLFDYRSVTVSADGSSLVTVASDATADIWIVPGDGAAKKITSSKLEGSYGLTALPDGRIVVTSLETGKLDLWVMNPDGAARTLLTRDQHENRWPRAAPDGKSIIYLSVTATGSELCSIGVDGSRRRVLAAGLPANTRISFSPDGKWVAYWAMRKNRPVVERLPIEGGDPVFVMAGWIPSYSPDGSRIAGYAIDDGGNLGLAIAPAMGGHPLQRIGFSPPYFGSDIRWTAEGDALIVNTAPSDRANLWRVPLDGSPPRRLTSFEDHNVMAFDALPNGGWVLSRGVLSRDAVLITGF